MSFNKEDVIQLIKETESMVRRDINSLVSCISSGDYEEAKKIVLERYNNEEAGILQKLIDLKSMIGNL